MTSTMPSATFGFVDREEEMSRICEALKVVKTGEGQILVIRGEAGSGKTRIVQEAAAEAKKQGFDIGFGTALSESVVPYHSWHEVLGELGLDAILEGNPPPKLLGLYLLTPEEGIQASAEREEKYPELPRLVEKLVESVQGLESQQGNAESVSILPQDGHRLIIECRPVFSLGFIVEGPEDEAFLADLKELANTIESMLDDTQGAGVDDAIEVRLRKLLESEKYEGIDYTKADPKLRQVRLFEHVALGLCRRANLHPICVVIDDLQWADPSSLALLHYASRNTRSSGILILGTYRVEEAEARPHLRDALRGMEEEELLAEMDLRGLSKEDLSALAESFVGSHDLQDEFLDLLWQETQGNPLFVREVLHGLEEDGALRVHGAVKRLVQPVDQLDMPERVREVIRARLDRLPKEDRRLLDAASTCGTRFTTALVAKVAGETEEKVLNGLRAITKVHGLLRPADSGFTFDHPAVQEVLYDGVPIETRQTYHKEAGEWLELAGGPPEDVAEHYYRSRSPLAVPKLRAAAEGALGRYANNEAARLLGEALELAPAKERGEILELQADAFEAGARYDEALEALDEALQVGVPIAHCKRKVASVRIHQGLFDDALIACEEGHVKSEGVEKGQLLVLQAEALWKKGEYSKAMKQANAALGIFGESGDPRSRADALSVIGMVHLHEGHYDKAERTLTEVLAIRETTDDRQATALSLSYLGSVLVELGEFDRALEIHRKGLRIREAIGDLSGVSASLNNIGNIYMEQGDFPRALELYTRALDIAEAIGNRLWIANQTNNVAAVCYHLGDLDKAIEFYERSFEMKEATGSPEGSVRTLINLGYVHHWQGDLDKTFKCFEKSLSVSEEMGNQYCIASSLAGLGTVYTDRGDFPSALKVLNHAVVIAHELGPFCRANVLDALTQALIHSRNLEEARERAEEHLEVARKNSMKLEEANGLLNLARCETACGNPDDARREFSRAIQLYEELKAVLDVANCRLELGLAERDWGNEKEARKLLEKALELFESRNLAVKADKAREALGASDAGA